MLPVLTQAELVLQPDARLILGSERRDHVRIVTVAEWIAL